MARLVFVLAILWIACGERGGRAGGEGPGPRDMGSEFEPGYRDAPSEGTEPRTSGVPAVPDPGGPRPPTADRRPPPPDVAATLLALHCADQQPATSHQPPALRDDAVEPDWSWERKARRVIDRTTLAAAVRKVPFELPEGFAVYAARIVPGVGGPAYVLYQAGTGAFTQEFWPASTVKVLAALGALDFVHSLGLTGAAQVAFDSGATDTLRAIIDRAIRVSSNEDYDLTVLVAGLDRLNQEFLTAERGFPTTVLERSYGGGSVRSSPGMTLTEGERTERVGARRGRASYGCPDNGNCADLFELTEAIRRVVLRAEIPEAERFELDASDLAALDDALCNADSSSFLDGARAAFGVEPRICHKTGSSREDEALDHGLIEDPATGARYLLAAEIPGEGDIPEARERLSALAEQVLRALAKQHGGLMLQPDAGVPLVVQVDRAESGGRRRGGRWVLTIDAPCADELAVWVDGRKSEAAAGEGSRFTVETRATPPGDHLVIVVASREGVRIGYRSLRVRFGAP
ncbi:MAG: hypothetical protein HY905_15250 [Deltaproteobacteria bacterium]|nr:hypothetical protein [Deltaproteobacteria bacterium]